MLVALAYCSRYGSSDQGVKQDVQLLNWSAWVKYLICIGLLNVCRLRFLYRLAIPVFTGRCLRVKGMARRAPTVGY